MAEASPPKPKMPPRNPFAVLPTERPFRRADEDVNPRRPDQLINPQKRAAFVHVIFRRSSAGTCAKMSSIVFREYG
jgi:hypothetical protein